MGVEGSTGGRKYNPENTAKFGEPPCSADPAAPRANELPAWLDAKTIEPERKADSDAKELARRKQQEKVDAANLEAVYTAVNQLRPTAFVHCNSSECAGQGVDKCAELKLDGWLSHGATDVVDKSLAPRSIQLLRLESRLAADRQAYFLCYSTKPDRAPHK